MEREISAALRAVPGIEVLSVQTASGAPGESATVAVIGNGGAKLRLDVRWRKNLDPRSIQAVADRLIEERQPDRVPMVASSYVAPALRRKLERSGVGWIDAHGNAHIEGLGVFLHVERSVPRGSVPRPEGRLFGPSAGRVAQAMLEEPDSYWSLKSIARIAHVQALSTVSRSLERFEAAGLVSREQGGWRILDAALLLDAWLASGLAAPAQAPLGFFCRGGVTAARVQIENRPQGEEAVLLTGPAAAELIEPLMPADRLDAYIFPPSLTERWAERQMGWVPSEHAPNCYLWLATTAAPRVGERRDLGAPIVGRAQLLLDLTRAGGRAEEVVGVLRAGWKL